MPFHMPLETLMPKLMPELGGSSYAIAEGSTARVGIVDDAPLPYVVKTLKLHIGEAPSRLGEEFEVLLHFGHDFNEAPPLQLPEPLWYDDNPLFAVYTKMSGQKHDPAHLSPAQLREAGARLGRLMAWTDTALPLKLFTDIIRLESGDGRLNYKWSYDSFFYDHVAGFEDPTRPFITEMARRTWADFHYYYPRGADTEGDRMNHAALIPDNLLWLDGVLTSVIDWDDVRPGNINQELYGVSYLGSEALEAAITELDNRNIRTDWHHSITWATIRSLGIVCSWIHAGNTAHPSFATGAKHLQTLYPHLDWSELYN